MLRSFAILMGFAILVGAPPAAIVIIPLAIWYGARKTRQAQHLIRCRELYYADEAAKAEDKYLGDMRRAWS